MSGITGGSCRTFLEVGDGWRGFGESVGDGTRSGAGGSVKGVFLGLGLGGGNISVKFRGFEERLVRLEGSGAELMRLC